MPNQLNSGELIASISADLADNNAGLISAEDVRHNMEDTAYSIRRIVASGDANETNFVVYNTLRGSKLSAPTADLPTATSGDIQVESGIFFPNAPENDAKRQVRPFLGSRSIDHSQLLNLDEDDHLQYYKLDGLRPLEGNMKTNGVWINASGQNYTGLKFRPDHTSDATQQTILVSGYSPSARRTEAGFSNQGGFEFMDKSIIPNGKGMAKAWLSLATSGIHNGQDDRPQLFAYHNISGVHRIAEGQLAVTFTSGTFHDNSYVAIGTASARNTSTPKDYGLGGTANNPANFEVNTVGIAGRSGVRNGLRECRVYIIDDDGSYQDSDRLDLVFFGYSPSETSGTHPTISRA